jgi:outer membrane protein TolC
MRRFGIFLSIFVLSGGCNVSAAAEDAPQAQPLPSPLTLEQALRYADLVHPDLTLGEASIEKARAAQQRAASFSGVRSYLELTPQSVDPAAESGNELIDDSRARVLVSKRLYDFGRSRALNQAAAVGIEGNEWRLLDVRQQRRLDIMRGFFDVLLADLRYAVDNEHMAHRYVRFDRARDRKQLGMLSDVEVLEMESRYRDALITRTQSEKQQTSSRLRLALALNRPDSLPANLVRPQLPGNERQLVEYEDILPVVLKSNPVLQALRKEVEAARLALESQKARNWPVIAAELEAAEYKRDIGSREDIRATLNVHIPLYQGGEIAADVAEANASLREKQARLGQAELAMHQRVLDLVQRLESLQVERTAARVRVDYRDLRLEQVRGQYELEMATTLGGTMKELTEAQWMAAKVEFELALAWAELDALAGKLVEPALQETRQ